MPVPPEGALYWDFVNGNLYGSQSGTGDWVLIGPTAGVTPQTIAAVSNEFLASYNAVTGLFTVAPVNTVDGVTISGTPSTGQVVTATSATTADWATPSGGGLTKGAGAGQYQTVRSVATSFTQGGITGPIALTFGTAFADNNYTVQVTIVSEEVAPETDTIAAYPQVGIAYVNFQATAGVGLNVWVGNQDSGAHTGYVHVTAIHD
jgi:hypothetical protein